MGYVIGVVGPIASGKSVLVDRLIDLGFINLRVSSEIKDIATKEGIPLERGPLQDLGDRLRRDHGEGYLAEQLVKRIEPGKNYVIDSIRNPGEIDVLRKVEGFMLVGFDAPIERRIDWIVKRQKKGDPKTREEIISMEARDRGEGQDGAGQQVWKCYEGSEKKLYNDKELKDIQYQVDDFLKEVGVI